MSVLKAERLLGSWSFSIFPGASRYCTSSNIALGGAAVALLFGLGGFWIHRMWNGRYPSAKHPYQTFLISRIWRLLPIFALFSVATIAVELLFCGESLSQLTSGANPIQLLASSIFIFGYNLLPHKPLAPAWSLDVECQLYLISPGENGGTQPQQVLHWVLMLFVGGSPIRGALDASAIA